MPPLHEVPAPQFEATHARPSVEQTSRIEKLPATQREVAGLHDARVAYDSLSEAGGPM